MDYYLRFTTEAAGSEALRAAALDGVTVDIVGVIYQPTGETQTVEFNGDKMVVPVMAPLPGWHVNLRGDALPPELEQYRIYPQNPRTVWL